MQVPGFIVEFSGYLVPCRLLTNTFHETHCISARSCAIDYVLVSFDQYWTILGVCFVFIPIGSRQY